MKTFLFAFLAITLALVNANAQVVTVAAAPEMQPAKDPAQIEQMINSLEGLVAPSRNLATKLTPTRSSTLQNRMLQRERFAPGEEPVFLLASDREFIQYGEEMNVDLYPTINSNRDLYAYVQVLRPGDDGEFDGTEKVSYFTPADSNYGLIQKISVMQPLHLATIKINAWDPPGTYTFNIVFMNSRGRLVQQILYEYYLSHAGHWGRNHYAESPQQNGGSSVMLSGKFPPGVPIYYVMFAKNSGGSITGQDPASAPRSDGTHIVLNSGMTFNRTTPVSIGMWSTVDRYCWVLPNAIVNEVPFQ